MNIIIFISILLISSIYSANIEGIDVSYYQGDIDWEEVKTEKQFAIIRMGYGQKKKDDKYEEYYKGAKDAGVQLGAYLFSKAESVDDAEKEAEHALDLLKGKQFEWPIYYDIEEQSIFDAGIASDIARAFCNVLEQNKYYCGIYSSTYTFNTYFDDDVKTRYTIWLAHWDVDVPTYKGAYDVWQYGIGQMPEIGDCDLDRGYLDFEPVMKEHHLNGY